MPELLPDILLMVFQQFAGDNETLLNISLTCRTWRSLALPCLYQVVEIGFRDYGRYPRHKGKNGVQSAETYGAYRQRNLLPRQRAFLRLVTDKPELASYVKSFTWTLVWKDSLADLEEVIWDAMEDVPYLEDEFEEEGLTEIERQTWHVFSRMVNVTHLDLASYHQAADDAYVRQNSASLFPKVRDLRLAGWMHRGLVRAILTSLDPRELRTLELDCLQDEGALPYGDPMSRSFAMATAHHASWTAPDGNPPARGLRPNPDAANSSDVYHDDLIARQEKGQAAIFPGPMWLPLHILSSHTLNSLTRLQIKVPQLSMHVDLRSYHTMFRRTADFLIHVGQSLESLVVVFEGSENAYRVPLWGGGCVNALDSWNAHWDNYRLWCIKMAKLFLEQQLAALNDKRFPRLTKITFEGFHVLEDANAWEAARTELASVFQSIRDCRFTDASFTDISSVDGREAFEGYDRDDGKFPGLLGNH